MVTRSRCTLPKWRTKLVIFLTQFCWQITLWLQGLFLFSLVWTIGGTITGDSRKKFDHYFRTLISGTDSEHPKPKSVKLSKSNTIPDRNTVYDFCFEKRASGNWVDWMDTIDKGTAQIPTDAKVGTFRKRSAVIQFFNFVSDLQSSVRSTRLSDKL